MKTMTLRSTPDFTPPADGRHDFNFIAGRWLVRSKQLLKCLQGCTEWEELDGFQDGALLLDGLGNMNDLVLEGQKTTGMALRFFNPQTRQWSIYWINSGDGFMHSPVSGVFTNGVGRFEGHGTHEGRQIRVRTLWSDITPRSARCEKAFSEDGGRHWETNSILTLTRPVYHPASC